MEEVTYTEQSNSLDALGIAYQRFASSNKKFEIEIKHTNAERLLLNKIHNILKTGMHTNYSYEKLDVLGKLYQRIASVNSGTYKGKGCPPLHQRVLKLIEDIIEDVL